jgi:WD40 repeat protein
MKGRDHMRFTACSIVIVFSCFLGYACRAQTASSNNVPPPKKTNPGIFGLRFSRDGQTIVTGNFNGTVKLWDVKTGRVIRTLDGHTDLVYKGVFNPDESLLASCSRDGKIKIWEVSSGREFRTLEGHTRPVKAVAFNPTGRLLASASNDGTVRVWDVATGALQHSFIHTTANDVDASVYSVVFISGGRIIAAGNGDGTISFWEIDTGKEIRVLKGHAAAVFCLALSADGHVLASGGFDHLVKLWDVTSGNEVRTFAEPKRPGINQEVRAISLSSDGKWLASSEVGFTQTGNEFQYVYKHVKIWNLKTGQLMLTLDQPGFEINGIAFSPDNRLLAGAGADGVVNLWDITTGRLERSFSQSAPKRW